VPVKLLFRTVKGLERVAFQEISDKLDVIESVFFPYGAHGWIKSITPDTCLEDVRRLRSVIEAYLILNEEWYGEGFSIDNFADKTVKAIPVYAPHARSVSVSAYSTHRRPSQRQIQGAFSKRIVEMLNAECNLKTYDTSLKISLLKKMAVASIDFEIQPGNMPKLETHPTPLLPPIAYLMIRLSSPRQHEQLLDPMCGCGTIPLMAAIEWKNLNVRGSDINSDYVSCAKRNAKTVGVADRVRFVTRDIGDLSNEETNVEIIAVNPPYGIALPSQGDVQKLYRKLLEESSKLLSRNGRIVLITPYPEIVQRAVSGLTFKIDSTCKIREGEPPRTIQVIKKAP
jgi:tRNA G10  N-methylase Trm11